MVRLGKGSSLSQNQRIRAASRPGPSLGWVTLSGQPSHTMGCDANRSPAAARTRRDGEDPL
jgi:hypothetical protein